MEKSLNCNRGICAMELMGCHEGIALVHPRNLVSALRVSSQPLTHRPSLKAASNGNVCGADTLPDRPQGPDAANSTSVRILKGTL